MITRLLLPAWIFAAGLLVLYSFTQVSLSLTLTQVSIWQEIQQAFQYIGYFNRPLSVFLYVALLALLFLLYVLTLRVIKAKQLSVKHVTRIIVAVSVIVFVSYNAFSFDIFNYIFDAKIVTEYGDNPYAKKALDYPGDPMLSFMQWTHRTYPYGPLWLGITIPVSYLGFQYFLPTYYLFKLLAVGAYLGTAWGIYKIVSLHTKKNALYAAAFFALNPLMIIEFLVSAHNDIVMLFLAVLGIYALLNKKKVVSAVLLILSSGVKYATGFLAPMILYLLIRPRQWEKAVGIGIVSMIAAVIAASLKSGNFQPWYLSYIFVIASFISFRSYIAVPLGLLSFFACLHYVPYLYTGTWDAPIPFLLSTGLWLAIGVSFIAFMYYFFLPIVKRSEV